MPWSVSTTNDKGTSRTDLVRTRSNGARIRPAVTAAATATPSDDHGYEVSTRSVAAPSPAPVPGSGTLSRADRTPLDQLSSVFSKNE
jgi:hypothetical protein